MLWPFLIPDPLKHRSENNKPEAAMPGELLRQAHAAERLLAALFMQGDF